MILLLAFTCTFVRADIIIENFIIPEFVNISDQTQVFNYFKIFFRLHDNIVNNWEKKAQKKIDFFVFGHRHLAIDYRLNEVSRYINLGDWIRFFTYAVFDGESMLLKSYSGDDEKIIRN